MSGDVFWLNGRSLLFTNWRTGEPNNANNNEDCVDFEYFSTDGRCDWNDFPCSRTEFEGRIFRPICKQEQTETAEREEDSPIEEFLENLMEILDPNGPIATPVATIGVLGK